MSSVNTSERLLIHCPLFFDMYSEEVCKELKGTGMDDALSRDLKNMEQEFNEIAFPFIKRHTDIFRY